MSTQVAPGKTKPRSREPQGQLPATRYSISRDDLVDLEFSDYGRDPRFLPGWWIVPTCFLIVVGVWVCLSV